MGFLTTVERRGADAGVAHALQVTPDNFARAESDMQFMTVVKRGGFGRVSHERDFPPAGRQSLPGRMVTCCGRARFSTWNWGR